MLAVIKFDHSRADLYHAQGEIRLIWLRLYIWLCIMGIVAMAW